MKLKTTVIIFQGFLILYLNLCCCFLNYGQKMDLTIFNMATTPVFKTNNFTAIGVGKGNHIWAGTLREGLYKFDGTNWEKAGVLLSTHAINDIKPDRNGGIWIAQSGGLAISGSININGGLDYFPDASFNGSIHYGGTAGIANAPLPSRNARSVFIDTSRYSGPAFLPVVWSAHMGQVTGGVSSSGGIGRGLYPNDPKFQIIRTGIETTNGLGSVQSLGGNSRVIWAFAPTNFGRSQILVYSAITNNLIGFFDYNKVGANILPGNFQAKAIYFDAKGKKWLGMASGDVVIMDEKEVWHKVSLPSPFSSPIVNNNAITGDKLGNVYIGTTNGLFIYNGGPIDSLTSYKRYSILDGLPSSNVKGIAIDKFEDVWVASDAGIARLGTPFTVYNLVHPTNGNEKNAEKLKIVASISGSTQINGKPNDIDVAADGSNATLIVWSGSDPDSKQLEILGDASPANSHYTPEYGYLEKISVPADHKLIYLYHHPQYVKNGDNHLFDLYNFVLKETTTGNSIVNGVLKIWHAPVLFVHGVWSSIQSFEKMQSAFWLGGSSGQGEYLSYQLQRWWFPDDKHKEPVYSALHYRNEIPDGIDSLLKHCRENDLSAGKVNIVGHSRGGLFARYYLQSNFVPYRNDVKSLITINSPHWGSQAANLVLDKRTLVSIPLTYLPDYKVKVGQSFKGLVLEDQDDPNANGAYELKVNADIISNQLNNPIYTNKNTVPSHAIVGTYKFDISKANLLDHIIAFYINKLQRHPSRGNLTADLRKLLLSMGSNCLNSNINECLAQIFNNETNDIVVPYSSQTGGLDASYITNMGDKFCHSNKHLAKGGQDIKITGTLDTIATQDKVIKLLRRNPNDPNQGFIKGGFKAPPEPLKYTFLPNISGNPNGRGANLNGARPQNNSFIKIDSTIRSQTYTYGNIASIAVNGSSDIKTILISYNSASMPEMASDVEQSNNFSFPYPVPKEASGKVSIVAYGYNDSGLVAIDTSHINIAVPGTAILNSIQIERNQNGILSVPANDSITFSILGYYSDTVRNITYLPGISYGFGVGGIASTSNPNYLKGLVPGGLDQLNISYLGKTDSIEVRVTDSIKIPAQGPLPVTLISFKGEFKNNKVNLYWATASEFNNKQFEIEYSGDALNFKTLGVVLGKGYSNIISQYNYPTGNFLIGNNYYRLKQVDLDGNFKYSEIIKINIAEQKQNFISFYPNPASKDLSLSIKKNLPGAITFQLLNLNGQSLYTKGFAGNVGIRAIVLPKLPKGVYIISVKNHNGEDLLHDKLLIEW